MNILNEIWALAQEENMTTCNAIEGYVLENGVCIKPILFKLIPPYVLILMAISCLVLILILFFKYHKEFFNYNSYTGKIKELESKIEELETAKAQTQGVHK